MENACLRYFLTEAASSCTKQKSERIEWHRKSIFKIKAPMHWIVFHFSIHDRSTKITKNSEISTAWASEQNAAGSALVWCEAFGGLKTTSDVIFQRCPVKSRAYPPTLASRSLLLMARRQWFKKKKKKPKFNSGLWKFEIANIRVGGSGEISVPTAPHVVQPQQQASNTSDQSHTFMWGMQPLTFQSHDNKSIVKVIRCLLLTLRFNDSQSFIVSVTTYCMFPTTDINTVFSPSFLFVIVSKMIKANTWFVDL